MLTKYVLEFSEAQKAFEAGCKEASMNGWAVTIAIVDDAGMPILVGRMDGGSPAGVDTAVEKARSAGLTGIETKVLEDIIQRRPGVATMKRVAVEGGVPIIYKGQRLGGVGVSGVMSDQDAKVAKAALAAIALE